MAWERSDRRERLPSDWAARREAVRRRAGDRCEIAGPAGRCPAYGTDCDHIARGDDHDLANLQWICRPHHLAKTAVEANEARVSARRAPGRHPGLL